MRSKVTVVLRFLNVVLFAYIFYFQWGKDHGLLVASHAVLPSEIALSTQHGLSRFTARAALATLERQGYLKRRARIGSVVVARQPPTSYTVQTNTAGDLLRFSEATDLHLVQTQDVAADAALAQELGCAVGESWIKVSAYRTSPETAVAVSWTDYYLRPEHRDVVPLIGQRRSSLRHLLDSLKKRPVERIEQQIEACSIPKEVAAALGVPAKSPALRVVYRTFSEGDLGRCYVAVCFYPAGRFRLTQTLMRDA
jgi:DNA-binding GntR family transcriptional regulator